jgi:hypothetical protein
MSTNNNNKHSLNLTSNAHNSVLNSANLSNISNISNMSNNSNISGSHAVISSYNNITKSGSVSHQNPAYDLLLHHKEKTKNNEQ